MDNIDCHPLLIFQENDNDGQASIPLYSEFLNDNLFENIFFNDDNLIDMTSYLSKNRNFNKRLLKCFLDALRIILKSFFILFSWRSY